MPAAPGVTDPADPPADPPGASEVSVEVRSSPGLAGWLSVQRLSFVFSTYQTGHLVFVGAPRPDIVQTHWRAHRRAMGLWPLPNGLLLANRVQIWRLENMLRPRERANDIYDRVYVPRQAFTTGRIDVHELCQDRSGRVVFVNTRYSCLATLSPRDSFTPLWRPPFVSALQPEDRCHLNGVALEDGLPRYVTAAGRTDTPGGWREDRRAGGVVIDVVHDRVVADGLSMPHSPRVRDGAVWALDSGRGELVRLDPSTGARETICFWPGFLRGLAFHGDYALITSSLPRNGTFAGLELGDALDANGAPPWCGVIIVDLRTGEIAHSLKLDGVVSELFDVAVLPGVRCAISIGPEVSDLETVVSFNPAMGALVPAAASPAR